jgi:hypothetical protein
MKDSRCTFVIFHKWWITRKWEEMAQKLVRVWPKVVGLVQQAENEDRQCKIDVGKNGSTYRDNLT